MTAIDARTFSTKVLIVVAAGALLLGLLAGGAVGAVFLGGGEAPDQKPVTGQPQERGEGPDSAQLDEDAFAPEGEVGADQ
ncbi:hypothetical protein ACIRON_29115 [Nocardioides sp. NPDC101246]|uniref:hypothetical protein n=1 Tax=Nocardioides sp. NPDC101246 TaxID=3364336 RepID=UPI003828CB4A